MPDSMTTKMRPAAFEDELMKLWDAQQDLTDRIDELLDSCGFKSEEYVDWLNDFCLGEGDQIERLVEMYREKCMEKYGEETDTDQTGCTIQVARGRSVKLRQMINGLEYLKEHAPGVGDNSEVLVEDLYDSSNLYEIHPSVLGTVRNDGSVVLHASRVDAAEAENEEESKDGASETA